MTEQALPADGSNTSTPSMPLTKDRQFLALLVGQGTSAIGDATTAAALPLLVLALTGSGTQMGIVGMLQSLPPLLIGLPAGALADRWNRRRMMIGCDLARALLVTMIPISLLMGLPTMAVIFAVVAPIAAFSALFEAAYFGAVPALVGRAHLGTANGYLHATYGVGVVIGPAMAGILSGSIGPGPTLFIDSGSFLLSAVCLLFIRRPLRDALQENEAPASLTQGIREGVRFILQERRLRVVLAFWSVANLISAPLVPVVSFYVTVDRGMSATAFGIVVSSYAIGSVLGALTAARTPRLQRGLSMLQGSALNAVGMLVLTMLEQLPALILVACLAGMASAVANVSYLTLRAGLTPDAMQGRVGSAARSALFGLTPVGMLGGGVLLDVFGGARTMATMGVLALALSLFSGLSRELRTAMVTREESNG